MGNSLRKEFGAGILGKLALDGMQQGKNYVVTSIRNPYEVVELRKAKNFYLIKLDAPLDLRYERFEKRRDPIKDKNINTKQEFIKREESEKSNDTKGLQLHKVFELADLTITNDKDEQHLEKQLNDFIKKHSK
jgi:dephospho-CoA kinase